MKFLKFILFVVLLFSSCKKENNTNVELVLRNAKSINIPVVNAKVKYRNTVKYSDNSGSVSFNIELGKFIFDNKRFSIQANGYKTENNYTIGIGQDQNEQIIVELNPVDSLYFSENPIIIEANDLIKSVRIFNNGLDTLSVSLVENENWLSSAEKVIHDNPTGYIEIDIETNIDANQSCSLHSFILFEYQIDGTTRVDTLYVIKRTGNDAPPIASMQVSNNNPFLINYTQFDTILFDATLSNDLCDGNNLNYRWSFDGGNYYTPFTIDPTYLFSFQDFGNKNIILEVRDMAGQLAADSQNILISQAPSPPLFNSLVTKEVDEDSVLKLKVNFIIDSIGAISNEITEIGILWSENNPNLNLSNTSVNERITQSVSINTVPYFGSIWTGFLEPNTEYYIKVYAKNNAGLIGYTQLELTHIPEILTFQPINVQGGGLISFEMGAINSNSPTNQYPLHEVSLNPFKLSKNEVTNAQYAAFMTLQNLVDYSDYIDHGSAGIFKIGSEWRAAIGTENKPVTYVSWYGAKAFCDWVGGYLPTEAQWEYASTNGENKAPYYGNSPQTLPQQVAVYNTSSVQDVGSLNAQYQPFFLNDMNGNVAEWVSDWYGNYTALDQTNPIGPSSGSQKVVRGGSYMDNAAQITNQYRIKLYPFFQQNNVGFRVAKN